jgi:hypothetical protein
MSKAWVVRVTAWVFPTPQVDVLQKTRLAGPDTSNHCLHVSSYLTKSVYGVEVP